MQRGFALIEILIGFVVVVLTTLAIGFSVASSRKAVVQSADNNFCNARLNDIMNRVLARELDPQINPFLPLGSRRNMNPPIHVDGLQDIHRWPLTFAGQIVGLTAKPLLRNSLLLDSAINYWLAIYNSSLSICTTGANYVSPAADSLRFQILHHGIALPIQVRIQSYLLSTGAILPCQPRPLYIRPRGVNEPPHGTLLGVDQFQTPRPGAINPLIPSDSNQGLVVTLKVNNPQLQCQAIRRFSYATDLSVPPPQPVLLNPIVNWPATPLCPTPPASNHLDVEFGYATLPKPGTILLCRDRSRVANATPACAVPTPTSGPNVWMPCDRVTACNKSPSSITSNTTTPVLSYKARWTNLPVNCHVLIDVIGVDGAANATAGMPLVIDSIMGS